MVEILLSEEKLVQHKVYMIGNKIIPAGTSSALEVWYTQNIYDVFDPSLLEMPEPEPAPKIRDSIRRPKGFARRRWQ